MKYCLFAAFFVLFCGSTDLPAAVLLTEGFESPAIASGTNTTALPAGWFIHSAAFTLEQVIHPNGSSQFTTTTALAAPASGNQALSLGRTNSGIYRMSGSTIIADTDYYLSAAIGNSILEDKDQFWSLQLWADSNGNSLFDGADTFLNQQFGTSGTALNASAGGWITNGVAFDSASTPSVVGKQLIVFLNNYGNANSESYYDNIMLSIVPEPSRAIMFLSGLLLLQLRRQRQKILSE